LRDHFAKLRNPHPITLTTYSVHLVPRPKDWPDHTDMTPPLFPEPDDRSFEPPADLADFLDASKPKPICSPFLPIFAVFRLSFNRFLGYFQILELVL
jgi:hypothetical protein